MKTRISQLAQSSHCAKTGVDEAAIAAQPLTALQRYPVAKSAHSGDGNDLASAPEQPFRSTLVDALIDQLREVRMKRFRPH